MKNRKKQINAIFITVFILTLTGCYSPTSVVSKQSFDSTIVAMENSMKDLGFRKTGEVTGKQTDVTKTSGIVYMPYVGYIPYSDTKSEETIVDTYSFVDSVGNTANILISYMLKKSDDDILYADGISIVGCQTSNPDQFNLICGDSSPVKSIELAKKEDTVSVYNETATIITASLIGIAAIMAEIILLTSLE